MWEILSDYSLANPLWLGILIVAGGFGLWLGYDNNRLKKKYDIQEAQEIKLRDDFRNYAFLFIFMVGVFGLLRRLYQYAF